ncbi:hypothetical protein V1277_004418 [Bradyrhizobium sp. AZCC 1588]|uniref:hypothetical protein n=1 Tax=unclassified Bradyrhizobium TaxID=2631580 RepID=UPI002FF2C1D2
MIIRFLMASALLGMLSAHAIGAESCDLSAATLAKAANGTLLAEDDAGEWQVFQGFQGLSRPTAMTFAYVVKEDVATRTGVIVVKTARWVPARSASRSTAVKLVRDSSFPDRQCSSPFFGTKSVSTRAYEDYHGKGFLESRALDSTAQGEPTDTNRQVLERFHSKYPTARGCRSSDSTTYDGFEYRNNRSQFSYDTSVVDNGWSYATTNLVLSLIPAALAAPSRLQQQRTEIFHYKVMPTQPTCIMFDLNSATADQVLRINDVEDRNSIFRTGEKRWQPPEVK